mmetsp:Transcript_8232/g.14152  ORF Transcript_8232/g.14152 Transcript_8232/m.14152 type:complete len:220 (+) Transcript_8232:475-1134(+)
MFQGGIQLPGAALVPSDHLRLDAVQEVLRQLWMQCFLCIGDHMEIHQQTAALIRLLKPRLPKDLGRLGRGLLAAQALSLRQAGLLQGHLQNLGQRRAQRAPKLCAGRRGFVRTVERQQQGRHDVRRLRVRPATATGHRSLRPQQLPLIPSHGRRPQPRLHRRLGRLGAAQGTAARSKEEKGGVIHEIFEVHDDTLLHLEVVIGADDDQTPLVRLQANVE